MKQCSPLCNKILGALRLLIWVGMLAMGIMKLNVTPDMITMVGGAWHQMWLTFLSMSTWFWIATLGEIIAWLFLVSGCCKLTKIGAWLTVVIMIFALNSLWWTTPDTVLAWVFFVIAASILVWGRGARCFCTCAACKTCTDGSCCSWGSCASATMSDGMKDIKTGAAKVWAGAVAWATDMIGKAKEMIGDVADKADNLIEKTHTMVDKVDNVIETAGSNAWEKVIDIANEALDKADEVIDEAKEIVEKIEEKTA